MILAKLTQSITGPKLKERFFRFEEYFDAQLSIVMDRLAVVGQNAARKELRNSTTPWGYARMAGEYGGIRFRPYGRSAGREDTGFMYDSLSAGAGEQSNTFGPSSTKFASSKKVFFGWPESVVSENKYIADQEQGFYSRGVFDPQRTSRDGVARFKTGKRRQYIQGADSLSVGMEKVMQVQESFFSGAWNEAKRQWQADGFSKNVGSYLGARVKPLKFTQASRFRRRAPGYDRF